MSVEKLPDLDLPDFGDLVDAVRPVLSYGWRAEGAHRAAAHAPARGHIIQPRSGAYWVLTGEGTWLVPAGLAIWIPPGMHHEVYSHGSVMARILFVETAHAGLLPARAGTVKVSPLLDALLSRTVDYGTAYPPEGPEARLARVMLDELAAMEFAPLPLPVSKEPRLARAMERVIAAPEANESIEDLAKAAGASPRTLARLFRAETGMTYTQWRTNLLLANAFERLEKGASVTEVALDLGYASPSSFAFDCRSRLGVPPGKFRARSD
ncbi:helix-turn-helix domain-containing protein [Defluviimonas salinarum]|uniref:AraC family transcriptional regulator n=1 Tax=Defluviimonas salinarum TaxID=2992147 RepID=A0ABT3IY85_9RHOB|nr:AraC family transcriptional regulator [Defluviimonas salinarum]MCW3780160.1 AraC family transcriptional regulator [Defluviimonas salinarum]